MSVWCIHGVEDGCERCCRDHLVFIGKVAPEPIAKAVPVRKAKPLAEPSKAQPNRVSAERRADEAARGWKAQPFQVVTGGRYEEPKRIPYREDAPCRMLSPQELLEQRRAVGGTSQ
jgi:hypothetical protein